MFLRVGDDDGVVGAAGDHGEPARLGLGGAQARGHGPGQGEGAGALAAEHEHDAGDEERDQRATDADDEGQGAADGRLEARGRADEEGPCPAAGGEAGLPLEKRRSGRDGVFRDAGGGRRAVARVEKQAGGRRARAVEGIEVEHALRLGGDVREQIPDDHRRVNYAVKRGVALFRSRDGRPAR